MPVGFDSTTLSVLLNPDAAIPDDPATGKPPDLVRERLQGLIERLQKERQVVVVPTPVVAEILSVIGPTSADYLQVINRSRVFSVKPFDEVAAIELAFLNRDVFARLDKKSKVAPYQKVKIDRQILAICKAAGCDTIYTDDKGLITRAEMCGMKAIRLCDLPIPDSARQGNLNLERHEAMPEPEPDDDEADDDEIVGT